MANKQAKNLRKHSKTQPPTKSKILESLCNEEQLTLIRSLIAEGSAFILLGDEHTPTGDFQKGLIQEMYSPTSNGVCCYDTYYKFKDSWDRPVITVSLNDTSNTHTSIVDSIKRLNRYRSRTLYTYHYEEES